MEERRKRTKRLLKSCKYVPSYERSGPIPSPFVCKTCNDVILGNSSLLHVYLLILLLFVVFTHRMNT